MAPTLYLYVIEDVYTDIGWNDGDGKKDSFVKVYFKDRCDVISLLSTASGEARSQGKVTMINSHDYCIARNFHWTKILPAQLPFGLQKFSVE